MPKVFGGSSSSSASGTIGGTIADKQVAYGDGADTIKGEAGFEYDDTLDALTVPKILAVGPGTDITDPTNFGEVQLISGRVITGDPGYTIGQLTEAALDTGGNNPTSTLNPLIALSECAIGHTVLDVIGHDHTQRITMSGGVTVPNVYNAESDFFSTGSGNITNLYQHIGAKVLKGVAHGNIYDYYTSKPLISAGATLANYYGFSGEDLSSLTVSGVKHFLNYLDKFFIDSAGLTFADNLISSGTEVSITGATTGTINKVNIVTGTSADYTITVPTAVGNRGKWIEFIFGPTLTELSKFVTLDGTSSEKLGGVLSRLFWAGESVRFVSDNTNWQVSSYKFMPMSCEMQKTSQSIATGTDAQITLDTTNYDNTGSMANTGSNKMTCRRTGRYVIRSAGQWSPTLVGAFFRVFPKVNNVQIGQSLQNMITAGAGGFYFTTDFTQLNIASVAAQDIILFAGNAAAGSETVTGPLISVMEQEGW